MKKSDLIKNMTQLAQQSANEAAERGAAKAQDRMIHPGDVILIPTQSPVKHWLIVKEHPEVSHLLYAIPADDMPEVGPGDLRVPEDHPAGPWTLRCGYGTWIDRALLDSSQRCSTLGRDYLRQARQTLGRMVSGPLQPSASQLETASDPDYLLWLPEVERSRQAVKQWVEQAGHICLFETMDVHPPSRLKRFAQQQPDAGEVWQQAAEGGGLPGRFARRLADRQRPRWQKLTATLYLWATVEGAQLILTDRKGDKPRGQYTSAGKQSDLQWTEADGCWTTEWMPWESDAIQFRFGPEKRKVVIRR